MDALAPVVEECCSGFLPIARLVERLFFRTRWSGWMLLAVEFGLVWVLFGLIHEQLPRLFVWPSGVALCSLILAIFLTIIWWCEAYPDGDSSYQLGAGYSITFLFVVVLMLGLALSIIIPGIRVSGFPMP